MITIDGSFGEGGGQILRTSLALSLVTGEAFRIANIRARRKKPGLLRQHLTSVSAAAALGDAFVTGASLGSVDLTFTPRGLRGGHHAFSIGTAGSTTLVLQTILVPLLVAPSESVIEIEGGTHNPAAPSFDFLTRSFLPLIARMGASVDVTLERPGFAPAGGGKIVVRVSPASSLSSLELLSRGSLVSRRARAVVANLPFDIAKREIDVVARRLEWPAESLQAHTINDSVGPGNVLSLIAEFEHVTEVVTGFGQRGIRAEEVADRACDEMVRYLAADAAVGEHLADQLLLPMAIGGGGSFTTLPPTEHTTTNAEVIRRFLPVTVTFTSDGAATRVDVTAKR